jgi:hypothetical protein
VQTSYTFQVQNAVGVTIASATFPCTTTYSTNSIVVDLSAQNGKSLGFGWSGVTNEVDSAWIAVVPYSVSSTPGKNTVPKTTATSATLDPAWLPYTFSTTAAPNAVPKTGASPSTLDPGWLPFPTTSTIGGVVSQFCSTGKHINGINPDGTLSCTLDSSGGTSINTLGCLDGFDHLPCTIAKLNVSPYSGTAGVASTVWYTNNTEGTLQIRVSGDAHVTALGTAGTMQFQLGVASAVNQCNGNNSVALNTGTGAKYTSTVSTCSMSLQNGESLYYTLVFTGATGNPTVEMHAYVERME